MRVLFCLTPVLISKYRVSEEKTKIKDKNIGDFDLNIFFWLISKWQREHMTHVGAYCWKSFLVVIITNKHVLQKEVPKNRLQSFSFVKSDSA